MRPICFVPSVPLDLEQAPHVVPIKGTVPQAVYSFSLKDIYPTVPAFDLLAAYGLIVQEFGKVDEYVHTKLRLREKRTYPAAQTAKEALVLLGALFDPTCQFTDGLWRQQLVPTHDGDHLFDLDSVLPFPLRKASNAKLLHTLVWIDTNIKVNVERVAAHFALPHDAVMQIVESALRIYSLLVKQQDYWLARSMNFNHSMFLQDRILNLLLGDALYLESGATSAVGNLSNEIALELLRGLGHLSPRQLCVASIFMGVVWTSNEAVHDLYQRNKESALADIAAQLQAKTDRLAVDDIQTLLKELGASRHSEVAVVLDDNGETVFDLALFQCLLRESEGLRLSFVVNRFPVSNNISLETLRSLLKHQFFAGLHHSIAEKRTRLVVEEQCFRSFELGRLRHQTRQILASATCVYIKGANFFETFQVADRTRFYVFTVYGDMAKTLTGYPEGSGIIARVPAGKPAFTYHDAEHIRTLRSLIETGS